MPISQAQFDQDLTAFITAYNAQETAIATLITASTKFRAAVAAANAAGPPPVDLSAEDGELATALSQATAATANLAAEATALGSAAP